MSYALQIEGTNFLISLGYDMRSRPATTLAQQIYMGKSRGWKLIVPKDRPKPTTFENELAADVVANAILGMHKLNTMAVPFSN